jgi:hypothetical protein
MPHITCATTHFAGPTADFAPDTFLNYAPSRSLPVHSGFFRGSAFPVSRGSTWDKWGYYWRPKAGPPASQPMRGMLMNHKANFVNGLYVTMPLFATYLISISMFESKPRIGYYCFQMGGYGCQGKGEYF